MNNEFSIHSRMFFIFGQGGKMDVAYTSSQLLPTSWKSGLCPDKPKSQEG